VELNLAAMLDMAFQLLTFFILTFQPPPLEGQLVMRLPTAKPLGCQGEGPIGDVVSSHLPKIEKHDTLLISVTARSGAIGAISVDNRSARDLPELNRLLKGVFDNRDSPFEQVVLQVSDGLRYEELLKTVEVCLEQRLPDGSKLAKLSFVPLGQR
jgi:biopolymer transport protein ExbD